ncbi:MAG TPA: hypothetical protein VGD67_07995, partial [Pseudonocardiaceae bacterium]
MTDAQDEARSHYPTVSERVLLRHRARVLHPSTAVLAPGRATPRPTMYRQDTLLMSGAAVRVPGVTGAVGTADADAAGR